MANVERETTHIAIGATDGYRYIGVMPPLTEEEINQLRDDGVLKGQVEQIELGPPCSLIRSGGDYCTTPRGHTEGTVRTAGVMAAFLGGLRPNHHVQFNPKPVQLSGFQSSPFNPVTP